MTAEQFLNDLDKKQGTMWIEDNDEICKAFITFAKYHVEKAIRAVHTKMDLPEEDLKFMLCSYNLDEIK